MKYYKYTGDNEFDPFEKDKVYKGSYKTKGWAKVSSVVFYNSNDWQEVPKPKKSLSEKIEKLRKQADKEGMKCEVVMSPVDIWEGVEFVECLQNIAIDSGEEGKIFKLIRFEKPYAIVQMDKPTKMRYYKPSTESAYFEQLKAKAKELFGEIKEADRFERDYVKDEKFRIIETESPLVFKYHKEHDALTFGGVGIYTKGFWAKKLPKRILVTDWEGSKLNGIHLGFSIHGDCSYDFNSVKDFLASQLEKYLNGEIE